MDLRADLELPVGSPDLTIICGNQPFKAQRRLLVTQSKVFERYCLPCVTCVEITPTRLPLSADQLTTRGLHTQYIHAEIDATTFEDVLSFLYSGNTGVADYELSVHSERPQRGPGHKKSDADAAYEHLSIYLAAQELEITELKTCAANEFAFILMQAFARPKLSDRAKEVIMRAYNRMEPGSQIERALLDVCSRNPAQLIANRWLHDLMKKKYSAAWDLIGDVKHYVHVQAKSLEQQYIQNSETQLAQIQKELDESELARLHSESQAVQLRTRLEAEINDGKELSAQIEAELADEQEEKCRLQKALSEAETTILTVKKQEFDRLVEKAKEIAEEKAEKARLQDALSEAEALFQTTKEQESVILQLKEKEIAVHKTENSRLQNALLEAEAIVETVKNQDSVIVQMKEKEIAAEKDQKSRLQNALSAAQERIRLLKEQEVQTAKERDQKIRRLEQELNQTHERLTEAQSEINERGNMPSLTPSSGLDKQLWISQSSVLRGVLDQIDAAVYADNACQSTSPAPQSATLEYEAADSTGGSVTPTESRRADNPRLQDWAMPPYSSARSRQRQDSTTSASSGVPSASRTAKPRLNVTAKEFQPGVFGNLTNRLRGGMRDSEKVADWTDGADKERTEKENSAVLIDI